MSEEKKINKLLHLINNWYKFKLTVPVTPSVLRNDADQNGSFFCLNLLKSINSSISALFPHFFIMFQGGNSEIF